MPALRIGGVTPLTTIDYPDHLSYVVYCQGCAWQCRYCHNPELIDCKTKTEYQWQDTLKLLKKRQGLLEAVVFSGGEPLLQAGIVGAIEEVKALGFKVGLHTGGCAPKRFKQLLPMIDWVGFDVKGLPVLADEFIQVKGASSSNWESLELLLQAENVDYECRTTVHWDLIKPQQLTSLAKKLSALKVKSYKVQVARNTTFLDPTLAPNITDKTSAEMLQQELKALFPKFEWVA